MMGISWTAENVKVLQNMGPAVEEVQGRREMESAMKGTAEEAVGRAGGMDVNEVE